MRCIGITTSLSTVEMEGHSPDAIFAEIGDIPLNKLLSLQRLRADHQNGAGLIHSAGPDQVSSALKSSPELFLIGAIICLEQHNVMTSILVTLSQP